MPRRIRRSLYKQILERRRTGRKNRRKRLYTKLWFKRELLEYLRPSERFKIERMKKRKYEKYAEKIVEESLWNAFWDALIHTFLATLKRHLQRGETISRWFQVLYELVRDRSKVVFVIKHRLYFTEKVMLDILDKELLSIPQDYQLAVINTLINVTRGRKLTYNEVLKSPYLRAFLERYIAYYQINPCKHKAYVLKLTPLIYRNITGRKATYYVLRWVRAKDMKADPFLGRTRPISFGMQSVIYKPDWDTWNAMLYLAYEVVTDKTPCIIMRDEIGKPLKTHPLRRIIYTPHWIRYEFARDIGKPEISTVIVHCSPYVKVDTPTRTSKIYEGIGDVTLLRRRKRKFVKEATYYMGLRW